MHQQKRRRLNDHSSAGSMASSRKSYRTHNVPKHPLGVKPLGNLYFETSSKVEIRTHGLGIFFCLEDEMIIDILR